MKHSCLPAFRACYFRFKMVNRGRRGRASSGHDVNAVTFPELHDEVLAALAYTIIPTPVFVITDSVQSDDPIETYSTHIRGQFNCRNEKCRKDGWGSGRICTVIRQFTGNQYDALVYKQRCKRCNSLGRCRSISSRILSVWHIV